MQRPPRHNLSFSSSRSKNLALLLLMHRSFSLALTSFLYPALSTRKLDIAVDNSLGIYVYITKYIWLADGLCRLAILLFVAFAYVIGGGGGGGSGGDGNWNKACRVDVNIDIHEIILCTPFFQFNIVLVCTCLWVEHLHTNQRTRMSGFFYIRFILNTRVNRCFPELYVDCIFVWQLFFLGIFSFLLRGAVCAQAISSNIPGVPEIIGFCTKPAVALLLSKSNFDGIFEFFGLFCITQDKKINLYINLSQNWPLF